MASVTRPTSRLFYSQQNSFYMIPGNRPQAQSHKDCFSEKVMGLSSQLGLLEQNATGWVMTHQAFVSTIWKLGSPRTRSQQVCFMARGPPFGVQTAASSLGVALTFPRGVRTERERALAFSTSHGSTKCTMEALSSGSVSQEPNPIQWMCVAFGAKETEMLIMRHQTKSLPLIEFKI